MYFVFKFNERKVKRVSNIFSLNLGENKPSLIALQVIWNKPANLSIDLTDYHQLYFTIRDKQGLNCNAGGGVGLWVEKSLNVLNQLILFLSSYLAFLNHNFVRLKIERIIYSCR